jgi:GMP synthase (glutamine-hydrolysing)
MKIGILQTGHAPDQMRPALGDYDAMFRTLLAGRGLDFATYDVVDGVFPSGPAACDGWLITGSRHGAYEAHPWIPSLEDLIRTIGEAGQPLVGVCFGHQIIAQAFGGRVEKFAGGWVVGRQTYDWQGETLALNAWHQDQVVELPPGAEVLAGNDRCAHAALRLGPEILTVQAHPEFDRDVIAGLIEHRGDTVPDAQLAQARAGLDRPVDNARIARQIGDFLRARVPA